MKIKIITNDRLKDMIEISIFILLLISTLLTQIIMPYIQYGIHNVLIPLFALMLIVLRISAIKEAIIYHRRTLVFMGLLYLWMWISAFQSEFQNTAFKYSIKYSYYPLMFTAFLFLTFENKNVNAYYRVFYYFLLLLGVFGVIEEFYSGISIFHLIRPFRSFMPRVSSLMQNPNPFGSLMSIGLIVLFLLRSQKIISWVELLVGSVLFALNSYLSGSRNAVLILVLGCILMMLYMLKDEDLKAKLIKIYLVTAFVLSIMLIVYAVVEIENMQAVTIRSLHGQIHTRMLLWRSAIQVSLKHPISGIGIGVYQKNIGVNVLGIEGLNAHNALLTILAELGLIGLFLASMFIFNLLRRIDMRNKLVVMPVVMLFAASIFDYFINEITFMIILIFFMSIAANSNNENYQKLSLAV